MSASIVLRGILALSCLAAAARAASPAAPRAEEPLWELRAEAAWDGFAHRVVPLPDVDGDGAADLALSVLSERRVELRSGRDGRLLGTLRGPDGFGLALAALPAAAGGPPALAVGAPLADGTGLDAGRVAVHALPDGELLWEQHGATPGERLGRDLVRVAGPDVDWLHAATADGCRSFAAVDGTEHAHGDDEPGWRAGVVAVGDVDGDGRRDFGEALGAERDEGIAEVWSGLRGALLHRLRGSGDDGFGWSLAPAGDVDGDGFDDLLVGAPGDDVAGPDAGALHVLSGRTGATLHVLRGDPGGLHFGAVAGALGDVDGDGRAEVFVSSQHDDGRGAWHTRLGVWSLPAFEGAEARHARAARR